jgi:acyl-CoA thioester hydrolase
MDKVKAMTKGAYIHSTEIPVRWYDMDAFGHVNNSVYFTYFEQARVNWWALVIPSDTSFTLQGPVIVTAHCTFYKPIFNPAVLIVKLFVGPPGNSSYEHFYEIYNSLQPDVLLAEGSTKVVWVDRTKQRSIPLPEYIRRHLPHATEYE